MIKYLGSKRLLVPALEVMAAATGAVTAVDLFTGTTRVAQALKRAGMVVTANDLATYAEVLAQCYIETDSNEVDLLALSDLLADLNSTPGAPGYFAETFCVKARFFQPKNGERVDAIRDRIERELKNSPYYALALTSLMEAADRVDSTTGLQMAYLKEWAPRAHNDLELRVPNLLPGKGVATRLDARDAVQKLPEADLMYLDPPYNQHRYFTNYHIWETLIRWDQPEAYGVAQKRADARNEATKSVFNKKAKIKDAFFDVLKHAKADTLMVSYSDEGWIAPASLLNVLRQLRQSVEMFSFEHKRYVGSQIGIHNMRGQRVGSPGKSHNLEHVFVAGDKNTVRDVGIALAELQAA